ncbi:MAG TPA: efflux RND transporter periplasmic adaptor subunit [Gemmatimonadaceae bacterium]|nr:efflux RND transporter periplasmic adaptor subunit [Gemmatimonadaceae bacterium]
MRRWSLLSGLLLAACGSERGEGATPGGGRGREDRGPTPVEVATAELKTAARSVTVAGTVEPIRTVGINSQLPGALLRVNVEEGDRVGAGQVLATIDSRELQAQLASAEASLEVARRAAVRAKQLHDQQIITSAEYERDDAAYRAAQATRDQLRTRLGYATIRSPITGVILEKSAEAGDIIGSQTRLFAVADMSTMVVRVPISELDVTGLDVGDQTDVTLDALPGRALRGTIRRIFPSADSLTRLVPVEVALTGAAARDVRAGFLARVLFRLDPREGVLMVPAGALVENARGSAVYVVSASRASLRQVQRGGTFQGSVEITDGLAPGDTVVVAGSATLRDGAAVRIVNPPLRDAPPGLVPEGTPATMPANGGVR